MAEQFVWRYGVMHEIAESKEIQKVLLRSAQAVAARASSSGARYRVDVRPGSWRAHARVQTADTYSYWQERKTHALMRSRPTV